MSGILDLLGSDLGKTIISGVANSTGNDESKTSGLLTMALPVLMQAMKKNASTPEGAEGLMGAINNGHGGGILDNLGGLFQGGVDSSVQNDGGKILGHILGNKQPQIEQALGAQSGMSSDSVNQILKVAAPILMGFLGKQSQQNGVSNASGIESLLGGLLGGAGQSQGGGQNLIESLLDADNDGSIIDDVAGMVLGGNKKKGGLGGLLGGLFGGK